MSFLVAFLLVPSITTALNAEYADLSPEFADFFISGNQDLRTRCSSDPDCPLNRAKEATQRCVGFEPSCNLATSYSANRTKCRRTTVNGRTLDAQTQYMRFFAEADFGYVHSRSVLHDICTADSEHPTRLRCADQLRHCWATHIYFDFANLRAKSSRRYREDVIGPGQVGGNCGKFYAETLRQNLEHRGYLQSWAPELQHFRSNDVFRADERHCDVVFDRPTIVIKLDAAVNMYHHFCDFLNLFASQMINGSFSRDVDVLWWDTDPHGFVDRIFGVTWKAFTSRQPIELISLDQKKVCFKNVLLPMLARQRYGLFYNTPLIKGCSGTGLFHAFASHVLRRLAVHQNGPLLDKIRVTFLVRGTQFRKVLNQLELYEAMRALPDVEVTMVDYNSKITFLDQLKRTQNSDVFMSIHGSGLTHLLFLPDWAAVFEIYNCDDAGCYSDLARLRGIKYFTWQKSELIFPDSPGQHPTRPGEEHKKFANYAFDKAEFIRIVKQMIEYVRRHPKFVAERRTRRRSLKAKGEL